MSERMQKVIDLIKQDIRRELSLSEMARSVNLSPSRLRHIFKDTTGASPTQYLRSLRMREARKLLETTFLSVKEIRDSVGISDRSHFIRDFKESYGVTPAQYRARVAEENRPSKSLTDLAGLLVLLVEDDFDTREVIKLVLEHFNARVTAVSSSFEALAEFERTRPDVLVADIGMPDEDGYALIRKVRALGPERGGNIPAVALTAYTKIEDRREALLAGFQIHIPKPAEPDELAAVVAKLMGRNAKKTLAHN